MGASRPFREHGATPGYLTVARASAERIREKCPPITGAAGSSFNTLDETDRRCEISGLARSPSPGLPHNYLIFLAKIPAVLAVPPPILCYKPSSGQPLE